jgi:serine/threonine protein kinase
MIDDAAKWQHIKEIVADALELEQNARPAFLRQACGADEQLLSEVQSLLGAEDSETASTDSMPPLPGQGVRIGPYVLQHKIGRGGIGQVWGASRADNIHMRVAIKLLRSDRENDEQFQRRFRAETQILALMRHPNIVTFLDAGTTEHGQPYFAMEYVEGEPITTFCKGRRLSIAQRLRLFLQVCEAVQHAHKYVLLHRDLKPSNILVTAEGTAKLLDFGIAKLLRPEILGDAEVFTQPNHQAMTPEYASPEQLLGGVLTTTSDVYSLGVVLFEMLTNRTPFPARGKDLLAFRQLVTESDPPPPSTAVGGEGFREYRAASAKQVRKEISGELDNIVLMAIRREPDRRYATVAELMEDIRHYLDGLPVRAQPDSYWYRTRKFVRRRRVEVTAACAVVISLAGGLGEAVRERNQARAQRDLAELRLGQVRKLAQSFEKTFRSLEESSRPGGPMRRELAEAEEKAAVEPGSRALQANLAHSYQTIAEALGLNGQSTEAERLARKAVAIYEAIAKANPADPSVQSALSAARALLAKVGRSGVLGATPSAVKPPSIVTASAEVVRGYEQLGEMLGLVGDFEGAIQAYSAAAKELSLAGDQAETKPHLERLHRTVAQLDGKTRQVPK